MPVLAAVVVVVWLAAVPVGAAVEMIVVPLVTLYGAENAVVTATTVVPVVQVPTPTFGMHWP